MFTPRGSKIEIFGVSNIGISRTHSKVPKSRYDKYLILLAKKSNL